MSRYPYTCLEQQVSRAVALRDEGRWRSVAAALPAHQDGAGLLKFFPAMTHGSDVLTAYVLAVAHEAGLDAARRGPGARRGRPHARSSKGTLGSREPLPTADLSIRKLAALEALSRYGKADPELLGSVTLEPNLWPTSAVLDWWSLLRRVRAIPSRAARQQRSRADPARAAQRAGHGARLLHRAHRRALVADGVGRRQRGATAAASLDANRGATRCRA